MGCILRDYIAVAAIANSGCCALMTPNDETHGSDRYRMTSGGLDILTIKCRLTLVGLGILMVKGPTAQVVPGILLHFGKSDGHSLNSTAHKYCFQLSSLIVFCILGERRKWVEGRFDRLAING